MHPTLQYFHERRQEMVGLLGAVVSHDSPSLDKEATDRLGALLAGELRGVGVQVEVLPRAQVGDILLGEWVPAGKAGDGRPLLILCHIDTVWSSGEAHRRPFRAEGARAFGPGVFDMKASLVMALFALRYMGEVGRSPSSKVRLLFTTDEEIGSHASRELIETEARASRTVLCLEPGVPPEGRIKTARKGVGIYEIRLRGRSAHAGADPEKGVSAVEEMARQVLYLHGLTDLEVGTTLNVGVARGGTRSNVVAEEAEIHLDVRVPDMEEARRIDGLVKGLKPSRPGVALEVRGGLNRPPFVRTPTIVEMFEKARRVGKGIGLDLMEGSTGGGSDGSFCAALGIPTLDGLGAVGHHAHSPDEYIEVDSLVTRGALLAELLLTL